MVMAPFYGKAYHIDEPFFLSLARQILQGPWGSVPMGRAEEISAVPWPQINNNPPLLLYALAAAWKLTGGSETLMRLAFLPVDLLAACSLYLLAGRFLAAPLLPTLIIIASPAYLINMNHLMTEKLALALALACLYALVRGVEERRPFWYWSSAFLLAAAVLSKYIAVFLFPAAVWYGLSRGMPWKRTLLYVWAASLGLAGYLAFDYLRGGVVLRGVWAVASGAAEGPWTQWSHRGRSFLAFAGGCGLCASAWALPLVSRRVLAVAVGAALIIFLPVFDIAAVRLSDRLMGVALAAGALSAFAFILDPRRVRGWNLWAPWLAAAGFLAAFYWSVMARTILFLVPPLILASAAVLEARLSAARLRRVLAASLAAGLALSLSLAWVDFRYTASQKEMAAFVRQEYIAKGRRVWCGAHLGLHHYLREAGALELERASGGWESVKPGDVVVVSKVNSNVLQPLRPVKADLHKIRVDSRIPLRLISGWGGEGGFYSNISGFLPFSFSREPVEEFSLIEVL